MKLAAIALDYDGTIAYDGVMDAGVRDAIDAARARGVAVMLVTGRRLDDLRRSCPDLRGFDAVVAENGTVLQFPASDRHVRLAHPPPPAVVDRLRQLGVALEVGECLIEMDAADAPTALSVVRSLEAPLMLAFNRGRLMLLPCAIGKSSGLRRALMALRLSIHNTIGIGDAENDHDFLDACEVGVAVSWGSPVLRAVADEIITGTGPAAVAGYLRRVIEQPRLWSAQMGRRRLAIGTGPVGSPLSLAIRGRTVIIAGDPGSGKSWLAGLLCEQLILQGYSVCVIDPEGDYRALSQLPGVLHFGGDEALPDPRELTRVMQHPDLSLIVDLAHETHREKAGYLRTLLPLIGEMRRRTGLPHRVLIDEAHYYVTEAEAPRLHEPEVGGYTLVTYRASLLAPAVRVTAETIVMVTRESDPHEIQALARLCQPPLAPHQAQRAFRDLPLTQAVLLPGSAESRGHITPFALGTRLTSHVRHRSKYMDSPVSDDRAFVFTRGGVVVARASTLKAFVGLLVTLEPEVVAGHLCRHDVSRWLADVFREPGVAAAVAALERRLDDDSVDNVAADIAHAIRARYEVPSEPAA